MSSAFGQNGHELPREFAGFCPYCGAEGQHELGRDEQCDTCGKRFRVEGWADGE